MKLKHKIILVICMALSSSILFAGGVSTANQINDTPLEQTAPNYECSPLSEFYNDIPHSEQNGINNPDYFQNFNHQDGEH